MQTPYLPIVENGVHTLKFRLQMKPMPKKKAAEQITADHKQHLTPHSAPSSGNQFQSFQQRDVSAEEMELLEKRLLSK